MSHIIPKKRKYCDVETDDEENNRNKISCSENNGQNVSDEEVNQVNLNENDPRESLDQHSEPQNRPNMLMATLQKIRELEDELDFLINDPYYDDSSSDEEENLITGQEAEALGFAMCAKETITFLENAGVMPDNPMMISLRNRLIGRCNDF